MTQLRKSILGLAAALVALVATLVYVSQAEDPDRAAVAERTAPGPSA